MPDPYRAKSTRGSHDGHSTATRDLGTERDADLFSVAAAVNAIVPDGRQSVQSEGLGASLAFNHGSPK
jgi:hypothetical protein